MYTHDSVTEEIIGCGIRVHRALGPGLMEATYEAALCIELSEQGVSYARQRRVPISYKGRMVGVYRPDLVVADRVVVEIKCVERVIALHQAQLLAYMRALRLPVGLLLNFNSEVLRTGVRRMAL